MIVVLDRLLARKTPPLKSEFYPSFLTLADETSPSTSQWGHRLWRKINQIFTGDDPLLEDALAYLDTPEDREQYKHCIHKLLALHDLGLPHKYLTLNTRVLPDQLTTIIQNSGLELTYLKSGKVQLLLEFWFKKKKKRTTLKNATFTCKLSSHYQLQFIIYPGNQEVDMTINIQRKNQRKGSPQFEDKMSILATTLKNWNETVSIKDRLTIIQEILDNIYKIIEQHQRVPTK